MSTPIGQALRKITTRNQWSALNGVLKKLNQQLSRPITARELGAFLQTTPNDELRRYGIWVESFGPKYAPIICINPAFGRANDSSGLDRPCKCNATSRESNYFGSQDYNGGRNACTASRHIAICSEWHPPTTGHLHSWRRGYDE